MFVMGFGRIYAGKCLAAIKAIEVSIFIGFDNLQFIFLIFFILCPFRQHVSNFYVFFHPILTSKTLTANRAYKPFVRMQYFVMLPCTFLTGQYLVAIKTFNTTIFNRFKLLNSHK